MRSISFFLLWILTMGYSGCDTCTDCEPVTSNPFISVRFQTDTTEANVTIALQQLNSVPAEEILLIGEDTLSNQFRFPINLNNDTVDFRFDYFLTTDTLRQNLRTDTLTMAYQRMENINERRRVSLSIDQIELVSSSFVRDTLTCFNPDNCTGDAHTVTLFL